MLQPCRRSVCFVCLFVCLFITTQPSTQIRDDLWCSKAGVGVPSRGSLTSGFDGWATNKDHPLVPETQLLQQPGLCSGIPPVISVIIWWNVGCVGSFLLRLRWCCGPVDGQGWFCPLSQSEWARRGLLFLLPDRAGGLGAGRRSLVRRNASLCPGLHLFGDIWALNLQKVPLATSHKLK